jgi:histidyl-tRNA synthetase
MSASITKPRPISGFPEWLPSEQAAQDHWMGIIREVFTSYGFAHIETPAVELTEVLSAKGVEQKEIYALTRLAAEDPEENRYSLHFDLTVPFARYVALHQGQLTFPFKRYQIQKVWRGERPAQGRFREFYQCDIDIVGIDQLPIDYDAEMLDVMGSLFARLGIGEIIFRVNHRKLLDGFYANLGIESSQRPAVLTEVDKLEKIGREGVTTSLTQLGLNNDAISKILDFAESNRERNDLREYLESLEIEDPVFKEGIEEMCTILNQIVPKDGVKLLWDGSITRGLNYYTGAVFETQLIGAEKLGSICSGGRYDDLCGRFSKTRLPGVGISLGLSRLLSYLMGSDALTHLKKASPTDIVMMGMDASDRQRDMVLASKLRDKGWKVELLPAGKLKKGMNLANKRGAQYVIIPNEDGSYAWKDMEKGEQEDLSETSLLEKLPDNN